MKTAFIIITVITILSISMCLYVLYEIYEHKHIDFITKNVDLGAGLKLCVITDLHNNTLTGKTYARIAREKPDKILLCGDIVSHNATDLSNARYAIKRLCRIADVFYAYGNHELYYSRMMPTAFFKFTSSLPDNCVMLINGHVPLSDDVELYGLKLSQNFYRKGKLVPENEIPQEDLDAFPVPDRYGKKAVVLAHTPEYIDLYKKKLYPDLVISGHLHGGIVRLPFIGGLLFTSFPRPKRDAGLYDVDGTALYVSRGTGSHFIPLRVFNRCEITFINI
ncbi:MAG: metallophosphoesterase [Lachnospiraceae bacterium]|nr:metallophosphoesterase [Lachnospiraceae bacterium]